MSTKLAYSLASILLVATVAPAYAEVAGAPTLWQPPEGSSAKIPTPPAATPAPHKHRAAAKRDPAGANKSTDALEAEVFGSEPTPTVAVRRPPAGDDSDESYGSARTRATGNLPAIVAPHVIAFALGTALMSRSFHFDAPLQGDAGAPRAGLAAALEAFPLLSLDNVRLGRIGVGASFATEIGNAGIGQPDNGTLIYPFTETRWGFDVRYAIPLGQRFLLLPRLGYGHVSYDLERRNQPAPSLCTTTSTQVCLPDVQFSHLTLGLDARLALTPSVGLSLGLEYLPGFGLGHGAGQLGSESDASVQGMAGTLAANWQLLNWLALHASLPITHYSYGFNRRPLAYTSASETYYGLVVGATVFTR
jgi:hypothetical protein